MANLIITGCADCKEPFTKDKRGNYRRYHFYAGIKRKIVCHKCYMRRKYPKDETKQIEARVFFWCKSEREAKKILDELENKYNIFWDTHSFKVNKI